VSYVDSGTFLNTTIKKYFFVLAAAYWIGNFMFNPKAKFIPSRPNILHQFGKVSYGIYMFNPVLIYVILNAFSTFAFQNYFVFLLSVHVTLALVTFLSYRFLETPFLALKEKYAVIQSGDGVIKSSVKDVEAAEAVEISPQPQEEIPIPVMVENK
jgi:peptidoglycan/LPS O-acetylase OafA/YrhL